MKRLYQTNYKQFHTALTESLNQYPQIKGRYHLFPTEGAFLIWLTLPDSFDSYELYLDCLEHKLGILTEQHSVKKINTNIVFDSVLPT